MAVVKVSDILTPDVWNQYGVQRTTELSAFWQSGVVSSVEGISIPNGGATINMPYWNDLAGDDEVLDDSTALTPGAITTGKDIAVVQGRGRAFGANDLPGVFAGDDPLARIIDLLAAYWARRMQTALISTLTGAMGAASMSSNVHDISAEVGDAAVISASTLVDAFFKLGDHAGGVTAMAMHSAVYQKLLKDDLIAFIKPSEGSVNVPTYLGKRVIVDDGMPTSAGVYTTYIFGQGAVGYAEATIGPQDLETDRDILAGDTVIAMRRRFILHPRGIKWQGTPAGQFPANTELATTTNWARVYDPKTIRVVKFVHKIA